MSMLISISTNVLLYIDTDIDFFVEFDVEIQHRQMYWYQYRCHGGERGANIKTNHLGEKRKKIHDVGANVGVDAIVDINVNVVDAIVDVDIDMCSSSMLIMTLMWSVDFDGYFDVARAVNLDIWYLHVACWSQKTCPWRPPGDQKQVPKAQHLERLPPPVSGVATVETRNMLCT